MGSGNDANVSSPVSSHYNAMLAGAQYTTRNNTNPTTSLGKHCFKWAHWSLVEAQLRIPGIIVHLWCGLRSHSTNQYLTHVLLRSGLILIIGCVVNSLTNAINTKLTWWPLPLCLLFCLF